MKFLYVGKFQPFHLGHLNAVNIMKELSDDIVLAIGSSKDKRYFSLDERVNMVQRNTSISPKVVEDLDESHPYYDNWGRYVLNVVGNVDIVATGNPQVQRDFYQEGKHILLFNRNERVLSGTLIRSLIESKDDSWKSLVPVESKRIIRLSDYYRGFNDERR